MLLIAILIIRLEKLHFQILKDIVDDYSLSDIKAQRVKKLDCLYGEIEGNCVDLWDSLGNFEILVEKGFIRYMTEKEREEYQTKYDSDCEEGAFFLRFWEPKK